MKKLSRLTALVLALMLALSMSVGAWAEKSEDTNKAEYDAALGAAITLYDEMMACDTAWELLACFKSHPEEDMETFLNTLPEEKYTALQAHFDAIMAATSPEELVAIAEENGMDTEGMIYTPAKNYTNVAGLANDPVETAPVMRASTFGLTRSVNPGNGLELSKDAVPVDGGYQITLEAYSTGTVSASAQAVPTDIVLVLDESGSMATDYVYEYTETYEVTQNGGPYFVYLDGWNTYIEVSYCKGYLVFSTAKSHEGGWYSGGHFIWHWGYRYEPKTSATDTTSEHVQFYTRTVTETSKRDALEAAATTFVNNVYANAVENNVDHRVAVIGFAGSADVKIGLEDDIRNNIGDTSTSGTVLYEVNNLNANGGTYIENGMASAKDVFDNAARTNATKRNRVVVAFTDGIPGDGSWDSDTISGSANPAISHSYDLINTYGATIYTIGMLDGADPSLEISNESDDDARTNKFLHYLSSNYPNAISMSDGGTGGGNKGYYLAASDAASLTSIFEKISEEIAVPTIDLGSTTTIKDIVSPYFDMPANASAVTVETIACTNYADGVAEWSDETTPLENAVTISGDTLTVTGFDFNANCVTTKQNSDGTYGKKLRITFTVTVKDGFLGGNNVPTNDDESGVFVGDEPVERFEQPTVNVPLADITVEAADKNVYLLGTLSATDLTSGAVAKYNGTAWDDLEDWQTAYVEDPSFSATEITDPITEDGTYTLTATLAPKYTGDAAGGTVVSEKTVTDDANINVFKPVLTFADSDVQYKVTEVDDTDYAENNYKGVVWKHGDTVAPVDMGAAPTLTLDYTEASDALDTNKVVVATTDIPVKVTVAIGETYVTVHTTFVHTACDPTSNCGWNETTLDGDPAFLLHVKNVYGDLKIIKKLPNGTSNADDTFIFNVSGPGITGSMKVVIKGAGSVTIKDLKVGSYTVTEDTGWSWRYGPAANSASVQVNGGVENTVTITNTRQTTEYWLDGSAYAENKLTATAGTQIYPADN